MKPSLVRFFWTVSPQPAYLLAGFGAIITLNGQAIVMEQSPADSALAAVLYLQMFAVSTAYSAQASRGHYDPVLVGGSSRWEVALAHWTASVAPGTTAWLVVALLEAIAGSSSSIALSPKGMTALFLVSTAAWGGTLALPRFSGGIIWSFILLLMAIHPTALVTLRQHASVTAIDSLSQFGLTTAGLAVCPFFLLSPSATRAAVALVGVVALGLLAHAAGIGYIARREYPLVFRT